MTDIYILNGKDAPWGDYGRILQNGMTSRPSEKGDLLCLERTGPFMPPITFPGISDIVVSNEFKEQLEKFNFSGFQFRKVTKKKIVKLNWESWNPTTEEPEKYPAAGEPENYIVRRKHSKEAESEIGDIWELVVPDTEGLQKEGGSIYIEKYIGEDICRASRWGKTFVSEKFKEWLEKEFKDWVSFKNAPIARGV